MKLRRLTAKLKRRRQMSPPAAAARAGQQPAIEFAEPKKKPHLARSHGAWVVYHANRPIGRYDRFRSACAYAKARTDLYEAAATARAIVPRAIEK
jgi:hypothetical protein